MNMRNILIGVLGVMIAASTAFAVGPDAVPPVKPSAAEKLTVAADDWRFEKNLYFGLRNHPEVMDLQEFLTDQGFYGGPVTGNYFLLTMQAVKKFQSANGVSPTGYFGALSRGKANEILEKLVGIVCPPEEGCDEIPVPALKIFTESSLEGQTGREFSAVFRVKGEAGFYEIYPEGSVPGLSWTRNECPPNVVCVKGADPDSVTLRGVPAQAGKYPVTILAKDPRNGGYGKATFVVVVKDANTAGAPAITGIKGPVSLKVGEEGLWTIVTSEKDSANLSYFVSWGDESGFATGQAPDRTAPQVSQTATFSHAYRAAGTYKAHFRVVNDKGLSAETSLSVRVGDGGPVTGPVRVKTSASLAAQTGAQFLAVFEASGGTAPYSFEVTAGSLPPGLSLMPAIMPMACSQFRECVPPPATSVLLTGAPTAAGTYKFQLTAKDAAGAKGSETFVMTVSGEPQAKGYLEVMPSAIMVKAGESVNATAVYQPPMPPCPPGLFCAQVMPASYPVAAEWTSSNPNVAKVAADGISAKVTGVSSGTAELTAVYRLPNGEKLVAYGKVSVGETAAPMGTLTVLPASARLASGQVMVLTALYQAPIPPCAQNTSGPVCKIFVPPPYPVNVEWSVSGPVALASAPGLSDSVVVRGAGQGQGQVKAVYKQDGFTYSAAAKIEVFTGF